MAANHITKHFEYNWHVKKFRQRYKEYATGVKSVFRDDWVDANGELFKYSDFSSVFYGEVCAFLVTEDKKFIMIKDCADAFGIEDTAHFWDFLNSKCTLTPPKDEPKPSLRSAFRFRSPL